MKHLVYIWPICHDGKIQTAPVCIKSDVISVKPENRYGLIIFEMRTGVRVLAMYCGDGKIRDDEGMREYNGFVKWINGGGKHQYILRPYAVGMEQKNGDFSFIKKYTVF